MTPCGTKAYFFKFYCPYKRLQRTSISLWFWRPLWTRVVVSCQNEDCISHELHLSVLSFIHGPTGPLNHKGIELDYLEMTYLPTSGLICCCRSQSHQQKLFQIQLKVLCRTCNYKQWHDKPHWESFLFSNFFFSFLFLLFMTVDRNF